MKHTNKQKYALFIVLKSCVFVCIIRELCINSRVNLKVGHVTVTAIVIILIIVTVTLQCHRLTIDNLQRPIIHRRPRKLLKKSFLNVYGRLVRWVSPRHKACTHIFTLFTYNIKKKKDKRINLRLPKTEHFKCSIRFFFFLLLFFIYLIYSHFSIFT